MIGFELRRGAATKACAPGSPGAPADALILADGLLLALARRSLRVRVMGHGVTPMGATVDVEATPALDDDDARAIEAELRAGPTVAPFDVSIATTPWRTDRGRQRLRAALRVERPLAPSRARDDVRLRVAEVTDRLALAAGWDRDASGSWRSARAQVALVRDADDLVRDLAAALGATGVDASTHGGPEGAAAAATRGLEALETGPPGPGPVVLTWRVPDALGRSCVLARLRPEGRASLDLGSPQDLADLALAIGGGRLPIALAGEVVAVLPVSPTEEALARTLAQDLRAAGVPATVDADGPLGPRLGAATGRRVPLVAILGPQEAAAGTVALRARADLAHAWPVVLPRAELCARVALARRHDDHDSFREANGRPAHLRRPDGRDGDLTNPVWRN